MSTILDIAYWALPAATVTALIARHEHRLRNRKRNP